MSQSHTSRVVTAVLLRKFPLDDLLFCPSDGQHSGPARVASQVPVTLQDASSLQAPSPVTTWTVVFIFLTHCLAHRRGEAVAPNKSLKHRLALGQRCLKFTSQCAHNKRFRFPSNKVLLLQL